MLESIFNQFAALQAGNFITKRLQHRCFPVNIAKFLKLSILSTSVNCFSALLIQSGSNNRKNRDVFREVFKDDNQTRIHNPVKYL